MPTTVYPLTVNWQSEPIDPFPSGTAGVAPGPTQWVSPVDGSYGTHSFSHGTRLPRGFTEDWTTPGGWFENLDFDDPEVSTGGTMAGGWGDGCLRCRYGLLEGVPETLPSGVTSVELRLRATGTPALDDINAPPRIRYVVARGDGTGSIAALQHFGTPRRYIGSNDVFEAPVIISSSEPDTFDFTREISHADWDGDLRIALGIFTGFDANAPSLPAAPFQAGGSISDGLVELIVHYEGDPIVFDATCDMQSVNFEGAPTTESAPPTAYSVDSGWDQPSGMWQMTVTFPDDVPDGGVVNAGLLAINQGASPAETPECLSFLDGAELHSSTGSTPTIIGGGPGDENIEASYTSITAGSTVTFRWTVTEAPCDVLVAQVGTDFDTVAQFDYILADCGVPIDGTCEWQTALHPNGDGNEVAADYVTVEVSDDDAGTYELTYTWPVDIEDYAELVIQPIEVSDGMLIPVVNPDCMLPYGPGGLLCDATVSATGAYVEAIGSETTVGDTPFALPGDGGLPVKIRYPTGVTAGSTLTVTFTRPPGERDCDPTTMFFVNALQIGLVEDPIVNTQWLAWKLLDCGDPDDGWSIDDFEAWWCSPTAFVRPLYLGGQLGSCGIEQYQVDLMVRGGTERVASLPDLISTKWGRAFDATTVGTVVVGKSKDCCQILEEVDPYATELLITRNGRQVWAGPVYEPREGRSQLTIVARDVSHWLEVRRIRRLIDDSKALRDGAQIAFDLIYEGLRWDDPNVLRYLHVIEGAPRLSRKTDPANEPYAMSELSDVARTSIDWTVTGRSIIVMPEGYANGYAGRITDADILGDYEIVKSGRDYASLQSTLGEGALRATRGGRSARYGLVERVNNEQTITSQEALDEVAEAKYESLPRPPIWVSLDDGVKLRPTAATTIEELVPGALLVGAFNDRCTQIEQNFRLQRVDVTADRKGESVSIGAVADGFAMQTPDATYEQVIVLGDSLSSLNPQWQIGPIRWTDLLDEDQIAGRVFNGSVPGATTHMHRYEPTITPQRSDCLIIFLGAVDQVTAASGVTGPEYAANLEWLLSNYPAPQQLIVFPWRWTNLGFGDDNHDEGNYLDFRNRALAVARTRGAVFVDMGQIAPNAYDNGFLVDWIHASDSGHRLLYNSIRAAM